MSTATLPRRPATSDRGEQDHPVVITGTGDGATRGPVLVAVDDDDNAGLLLRQGCEVSGRLGVSLRVAYVWSRCRPPDCPHHRRCHRDLGDASHLLSTLLAEHLTEADPEVEREVLHDEDPAGALIALSAGASLLIVGSSSDGPASGEALGRTSRALAGRTYCPMAVVRRRRLSATRVGW